MFLSKKHLLEMLHFFACDRQTRKKKTKYMSLLPFYGDFLRPLHFKLESGCASFCYVLKTCRFVWVSSLGRPNIGSVWHGKFTNFVKTFVKLFFSHIFFAQNRLKLVDCSVCMDFFGQNQDTDLVEDAKYVGDASFLSDMPDKNLGFNSKSTVNRW